MNKEKIKKFWKENKNAIIFGAGCGVGCLIGGKVMYKAGRKDAIPWGPEGRKIIEKVITIGPEGRYPIGWLIENDGIETKDLGKFGERLVASGCPSDKKFMRFMAISNEAVSK